MKNIFEPDKDGYYELNESTQQIFKDKLVSNKAKRDFTLIAKFPKSPPNGDGTDVNVYCVAMPAEFYHIEVLDGKDSCNQPHKGFKLGTGSGREMAQLAYDIAKAASEGMIGIDN